MNFFHVNLVATFSSAFLLEIIASQPHPIHRLPVAQHEVQVAAAGDGLAGCGVQAQGAAVGVGVPAVGFALFAKHHLAAGGAVEGGGAQC